MFEYCCREKVCTFCWVAGAEKERNVPACTYIHKIRRVKSMAFSKMGDAAKGQRTTGRKPKCQPAPAYDKRFRVHERTSNPARKNKYVHMADDKTTRCVNRALPGSSRPCFSDRKRNKKGKGRNEAGHAHNLHGRRECNQTSGLPPSEQGAEESAKSTRDTQARPLKHVKSRSSFFSSNSLRRPYPRRRRWPSK